MNYLEMKTQFKGLLNRRDITPALVETFMQQGIARIQRELRCPPMEAAASIAIDSSNMNGLPVPSNLLELISLTAYDLSGNFVRTLTGADIQHALGLATVVGDVPQVYSRRGSSWVLGPAPAVGMTVRIDYYAELSVLAADTDTNTLTRIAPDLFIYAALSYAADYYLDKRAANFEQRYTIIRDALQDQADLDELTASKAVQSAYDYQDSLWDN